MGAKRIAWRRDPVILQRLIEVERLHLAGRPNTLIAAQLGVDEKTIRNDLERIRTLWRERTGEEIADLKARAVAELEDVRRRAIASAEHDERMERAVLFNEPQGYRDCPGNVIHYLPLEIIEELEAEAGEDGEAPRSFRCTRPHRIPVTVHRDAKGSAQFRGQKAQALNVARQAAMDKAKILALVTERQELTGPNGGPIEIDDAGLSDEERAARIMAIFERARVRAERAEQAPSDG